MKFMDALVILMSLMLHYTEPCITMPDKFMRLSGREYRIETYRCGDAVLKVWSRQCVVGAATYWSRPFLMEDEQSGKGVYMNQFAELQAGWHVSLDSVYYPACTS